MKINKITYGFVAQQWDTELQKWTSQEFIAGEVEDYETEDGDPPGLSFEDALKMEDEPLSFEMVQPQ